MDRYSESLGTLLNITGAILEQFWTSLEHPMEQSWNIPGAFLDHPWNNPGTFPERCWNILATVLIKLANESCFEASSKTFKNELLVHVFR